MGVGQPSEAPRLRIKREQAEGRKIKSHLMDVLYDCGYPGNIKIVQCQDPMALDLLFVTQMIYGKFLNVGPPGEEVLQDDITKPGEQERMAHEMLFREFGWRTQLCISRLIVAFRS